MADCRAGLGSLACEMRQQNGRVSTRCSACLINMRGLHLNMHELPLRGI